MNRIAVFVDAGYFWVQLCRMLTGDYSARKNISVNYPKLREMMLDEVKKQFGADSKLLRVYWYDAPGLSGKTAEHSAIELLDDFKLRLGTRTAEGNQKGVDGLIIADLLSLTQQRAISDALLVTGDGDMTPGVLVAQGMGLRVHLLSLGATASTSPYLAAEVDFKSEWPLSKAKQFAKAANTAVVTASQTSAATNIASASTATSPAKGQITQPSSAPALSIVREQQPRPAPSSKGRPSLLERAVVPASSEPTDQGPPVGERPPEAVLPGDVIKSFVRKPRTPLTAADIAIIVALAIDAMKSGPQAELLAAYAASKGPSIPTELDRCLMTAGATHLGRRLIGKETPAIRAEFKRSI